MTEDQTRAALTAHDAIGDVEPWIAGRPWQAVPGGWTVAGELQGWRFGWSSRRAGCAWSRSWTRASRPALPVTRFPQLPGQGRCDGWEQVNDNAGRYQ